MLIFIIGIVVVMVKMVARKVEIKAIQLLAIMEKMQLAMVSLKVK